MKPAKAINALLRPFGVRLTSVRRGRQRPVHEPAFSYMKDRRLQDALLDELARTAESFFRERLPRVDAGHMDFCEEVRRFRDAYIRRPFRDPDSGGWFHNGFWLHLLVRALKPELIVESGVYRGHMTWLLEQAAGPGAAIHGFDIDLGNLEHRSGRAEFHERDWFGHAFDPADTGRSLVYFDCRVNHAQRIIEAHRQGFRRLVFDDNPPIHKLYAYREQRCPTANMLAAGIDPAYAELAWSFQGRDVSCRIDMEAFERARALIRTHEVFPDVGGPTKYEGFCFLAYVELQE